MTYIKWLSVAFLSVAYFVDLYLIVLGYDRIAHIPTGINVQDLVLYTRLEAGPQVAKICLHWLRLTAGPVLSPTPTKEIISLIKKSMALQTKIPSSTLL